MRKLLLTFITIITLSAAVSAADKACLLESTVATDEVKNCIQGNTAFEEGLIHICKLTSDERSKASGLPAKITYISSCPKQPQVQATCFGLLGSPFAAYYYKHSEQSLAASKTACENKEGTWAPYDATAAHACLLEGVVTNNGITKEVKDCLQNDGAPDEVLKYSCKMASDMTVAIGGPPAKMTYMNTCPKQPQATCKGFLGQPLTSYYYKRSKKLLDGSKSGCEIQGGKWTSY